MHSNQPRSRKAALLIGLLVLFGLCQVAQSAELLVSDRLNSRILRYDDNGNYIGVLVADATNLVQPNGMTLSPDGTKLYVSALGSSRVVRYDYNGTSATNPQVYASNGGSTISLPANTLFDKDDPNKLYVANLGGTFQSNFVSQFTANGVANGANITGGPSTGRSGLIYNPAGTLLVSTYGGFGGGSAGGILQYDSGTSSFIDFVPQSANLKGAAFMYINGNDLYLAAGASGNISRYNATTGVLDTTFQTSGFLNGLDFPADIKRAPDGNGILVGILGSSNGTGNISHFALDGTFLGIWAPNHFADPANGFGEATSMLVVPEPSAFVLGGLGSVALLVFARRRRTSA